MAFVRMLAALTVLSIALYSTKCDYTNCEHDLAVLEYALYHFSPENRKQLNKVFYPPREAPSRFIKVHYKFEDHDCEVTYIWAIGGFLLMQPPTIFRYTSLYFSNKANHLTDMTIQLPKQCWPLVEPKNGKNDKSCTCDGDDYSTLDMMTQQLNVYAKYSDPSFVVRDPSLHMQAICDEELKRDYYNSVIFMTCVLVIPLFFMASISVAVRSYHEEIHQELVKEHNHGYFAAYIIIGIFTQFVILGIDSAAVYYVAKKEYEYKDYHLQHNYNIMVTYFTLTFDVIVGLVMFLSFLYLWCTLLHRRYHRHDTCNKVVSKCLTCRPTYYCCSHLFCVVFGPRNQKKVWGELPDNYDGTTDKERQAIRKSSWVMLIMLVSPLFSVTSHGGYILVAWITEPSKATETAIITVAVLIYASLMFRYCYIANIDTKFKQCTPWSLCLMCAPIWHCLKYFIHCFEMDHEGEELLPLLNQNRKVSNLENRKEFDLHALCITLFWGILVVGSLAFTIIAFSLVPFKTLDLASYLVNIIQILIVVVAALITYKIVTFGEPDLLRFMKRVRIAYDAAKKQQLDGVQMGNVQQTNQPTGQLPVQPETSTTLTGVQLTTSTVSTVQAGGQPAVSTVQSGQLQPTTSIVQAGGQPAVSTVQSGQVQPTTSIVQAGGQPAVSTVQAGEQPAVSTIQSGQVQPTTSIVQAGGQPAVSTVQSGQVQPTTSIVQAGGQPAVSTVQSGQVQPTTSNVQAGGQPAVSTVQSGQVQPTTSIVQAGGQPAVSTVQSGQVQPTTSIVQAGGQPAVSTVQSGQVQPTTSNVQAGGQPAVSTVQAGGQPAVSTVQSGQVQPTTSIVQAGGQPAVSTVQSGQVQPTTSNVQAGGQPAVSTVQAGGQPAVSTVQSGQVQPTTSNVQAGGQPAVSTVQAGRQPAVSTVQAGRQPAVSTVQSGQVQPTTSIVQAGRQSSSVQMDDFEVVGDATGKALHAIITLQKV